MASMCFVSPANSLGLMRGGIDAIYQTMFPSAEHDVRQAIAQLGIKDSDGQFILPVGSALFVNLSSQTTVDALKHCRNYLICAPSMAQPGSNIAGTHHAYWCCKSVFTLVKKLPVKIDHLIMPGIGTGVGGMSYQESARAMISALRDARDLDESPEAPLVVINTQSQT